MNYLPGYMDKEYCFIKGDCLPKEKTQCFKDDNYMPCTTKELGNFLCVSVIWLPLFTSI